MILKIGNRSSFEVGSLEEASKVYARERDASYEGASTFPGGSILKGGKELARVSYNAKVWPPGPWHRSLEPLYNPSWSQGK